MNLHHQPQKVFKMVKKQYSRCTDRQPPDSSPDSTAESESALDTTMVLDTTDSTDISDILSKSNQIFIQAETSVSSGDMTSLALSSPAAGVSGVGQGKLFNEK